MWWPLGSRVVAEARWVEVGPERLERWLTGFGERHGGIRTDERQEYGGTLQAEDGSTADVHLAFPPVRSDLVEHGPVTRSKLRMCTNGQTPDAT